jgi:drug/metabolite transporter (DMT)-like permease
MAVETKSQPFIGPACAEGMIAPQVNRNAQTVEGSRGLADRKTLAAFAGFVLIVGTATVSLRHIYTEVTPFWTGFMRFAVGSLIFWAMLLIRRVELPRGRALAGAALYGFLSVGLSFMLLLWGLSRTPAGVTSTVMSIVPLLTIFFAGIHGLEVVRMRGVVGGLLAVGGIAAIMSSAITHGAQISAPHMIAIVLGSAVMAESGVVAKLIVRSHPIATNAIGMTVGCVVLLAAALIAGETPVLPVTLSVWLVFIYLVTIATVGPFSLYLYVLSRWSVSGISYGFVLSPIVAVILAATLAGEKLSWLLLLGGLLVLVGVWYGALSGTGKPAVSLPQPLPAGSDSD